MESAARRTRPSAKTPPVDESGLFTEADFSPDVNLPSVLSLALDVRDADTIAELFHEPEDLRQEYALRALRIGVLALRQARGGIDGEVVRRESDRLLDRLQGRLREHAEAVNGRLTDVLKQYFDPQDGRFNERLERLVKRDGELEEVMRRQIGQEDSELRRTLVSHIGDDSQLMKLLSPNESEGVLAALKDTLESQLGEQRDQVLQQFSLDNREGALSRFISELTDRQGELSEQLQERLDEVVKEFSLDDESSALSRLVQNVDRAQKTITSEFSLDEEQSALSRLKKLLENTNTAIHQQLSLDDDDSPLARLKREMLKLLEEQNETSREFQQEVRLVLETMKARKEEADRSTRHGLEFEDVVGQFVASESSRVGDVSTATGNSKGLIGNRKFGDFVIELGPDSAAPEAKIVVEAKEDKKYTLARSREEIEVARKNRGAQIGIFVASSRTADANMEALARIGDDIFVVWDAEDASSDVYFRAALSLARALCVRGARSNQASPVDFERLDRAILEIEKRAGGLDDIVRLTTTIQSNAEKVLDRVRIDRKSFTQQIEILRETTADFHRALGDSDSGSSPSPSP